MYQVKVKPQAFNLSISSSVPIEGMSNRSTSEGTDRLIEFRLSIGRGSVLHLSHLVGCSSWLESQYFMTLVLHFVRLHYELVIGC